MEDDHRVVHLNDRRARLGQRLHFVSQLLCQRQRQLLPAAVVLIEGQRGQGVGAGDDRFDGLGAVLGCEPVVPDEDRLAPGDRAGHLRPSIVSIRIKVTFEATDFHAAEAPHDISLVIVPADLPVRNDVEPSLDLLADDLDRNLILDPGQLLARYLPAVASVDRLAKTRRAWTVRDLGVVADDGCLHGSVLLCFRRLDLSIYFFTSLNSYLEFVQYPSSIFSPERRSKPKRNER